MASPPLPCCLPQRPAASPAPRRACCLHPHYLRCHPAPPPPLPPLQVRSSGEPSKRSFLERKGLTAEEIAEALRRVPEPTGGLPAAATAATTTVPGKTLPGPAPSSALQATLQHVQPGQYAPSALQHLPAQPPPQQQQQPVRWTQVRAGCPGPRGGAACSRGGGGSGGSSGCGTLPLRRLGFRA